MRIDDWMRGCVGACVLALLAGCGSLERQLSRAFIHPERTITATPADYGLEYRDVSIETAHGSLRAWFVPSERSRGETVVFCHGDNTSIGDYGTYVRFLHAAGFHVFLYDYPGYGESAGAAEISPLFDTIDDVIAAAFAQPEVDRERVSLYGISLGSIVALHAAARHPTICAVAVENPTSPDANVAAYLRREYGWFSRTMITAFLDTFVLPWGIEPIDGIASFDGPVFLVAADGDRTLDVDTAIELAQSRPQTVSLWMMRDTGHAPDSIEIHEREYPAQITGFFRDALDGVVRPVKVQWRSETTAAGHRVTLTFDASPDGHRRPIRVWVRSRDGRFTYRNAYQGSRAGHAFVDVESPPIAAGAHPPRVFQGDGENWTSLPSRFPRSRDIYRELSFHSSALRTSSGRSRLDVARVIADLVREYDPLHPRLEAEMVPLFLELGRAFEEAKESERAAAWYRRCVAAAPEFPKAHFWLGDQVRIMRFQHGAAVEAAWKALGRAAPAPRDDG